MIEGHTGISRLKKSPGAAARWIVLAALLAAQPTPLSAARFDDLQLVYHATFANGSLNSGIDSLQIGQLKLGDTGQTGINASWRPLKGDYLVEVTRPTTVTGTGAVATGIFAAPVNFDVGSIVGLRATFIAPVGPHNSTDLWAVAVIVRPGGVNPLIDFPRAAATLQVRGAQARLNTPGASVPANLSDLPQEIYDAIFSPTDPQPFTLELLVDRKTGLGEASFKAGDAVFSHTFQFADFKADSGPVITNVGANIAIANAPGQRASVRIRDLQIFSLRPGSLTTLVDPLCPPGFGCRTAPETQ